MTFTNSLTLGSVASTTFQINGNTTRGTDFDGVNVGGTLTHGGTLTLNFGTTFGEGNYTFNLFDSSAQSGDFTTVELAGNYSGTLVNSLGVWTLNSGVNTWTFTQSTGDLSFTVAAIPEPRAVLLSCLGVLLLLVRRRR
jgi:hypothetical protein